NLLNEKCWAYQGQSFDDVLCKPRAEATAVVQRVLQKELDRLLASLARFEAEEKLAAAAAAEAQAKAKPKPSYLPLRTAEVYLRWLGATPQAVQAAVFFAEIMC